MLLLVSRITDTLMACASDENDVISCGLPLSKSVKSSLVRPLRNPPSAVATVAKTATRSTEARNGDCGGCCANAASEASTTAPAAATHVSRLRQGSGISRRYRGPRLFSTGRRPLKLPPAGGPADQQHAAHRRDNDAGERLGPGRQPERQQADRRAESNAADVRQNEIVNPGHRGSLRWLPQCTKQTTT